MSKKIIFIVLSNLLPLTILAQEIGFPIIRNYSPKEYKGNPQITCSIQDNRGVMYFGSDKLIEYDGVSWRDVNSNTIVCAYDLKKDRNGKIYVAAIDEFGYLSLDKKGYTNYISLTHLLPDSTIKMGILKSIAITSKFIYFQSLEYILQYSPTNEKIAVFQAENGDTFTNCFESKDSCYILSTKNGIQKIENEQIKPTLRSDIFTNKSIISVLPFNDSTFLFPVETKGLFLFSNEKNDNPRKIGESYMDFFNENGLNKGTHLTNGNFILGSTKKGAALFNKNGQLIQQYNENNNLSNNYVYSISVDSSDNLWMNLNNGIGKTNQSQGLSYWNKTSGLQNNVLSMYRYNGTVYVGTYLKSYFIDTENKIQEIRGMPDGMVWCFLEATQTKTLLVGTQHGIYQLDRNKKITPVYKGSHATFIYQSKINPNRFFSTDDENFISFRFENNKWIIEGRWNEIKDDIRYLEEDENGELWMSTYIHGVIRLTPDQNNITTPGGVKYYDQKDGIKTLQPLSISKIKNKIILNTADGFFVYNKFTDRFEPYCELGNQFCNGDQDILYSQEMPDGKIWICPSNNKTADIGYLQPNQKGGYDWIYGPLRRIPNFNLDVLYIEQSGIAWFGGNEGIYRFDLSRDTKDYSQKFNCLIRKVTYASDSSLNIISDIEKIDAELPYKFNSLKFEFAAPFFDSEELTMYSYKLDGFDKEWSKWSRQTEKEYTNLNEKKYTFQVKARNIYNIESDIANYQVSILPPFYRSWWAYLAYIILSGFSIYLIVLLNAKRLQREKTTLEEVIKQRTAKILEQKEMLETANATKDKFFKIISHDLRNPFNTLIGFSELLSEEIEHNDLEKSREYSYFIRKSANELYSLTNNLLNWSLVQTNGITFSSELVNIRALINNSISISKNFADKKGIFLLSTLEHDIHVIADSNMLDTVIRNLIANAIKFSRKDDKITIEVEELEKEIVIHVTDTGIGMEKTFLDKLFKIGENIKSAGTDQEPGTGLGLILCKEFIDKHNGEIWAESEKGKGSRFSFKFPKIVSKI